MGLRWVDVQGDRVVPRKGDVDRNTSAKPGRAGQRVVPRKGDVDRNAMICVIFLPVGVVPRKGDVDRNSRPKSLRTRRRRRPPQGGRG